MSWNDPSNSNDSRNNRWGGPWTTRKLDAFAKYVWSYLTIMKKRKWETIYFDGFAGSGSKITKEPTALYLELEFTEEEEQGYRGAAERVLDLKDELAFDYYYFVDKDSNSVQKLEEHLKQQANVADKKLEFRAGNANEELEKLAKAMKAAPEKYAALVFLDPFGMQIDWSAIAGLAQTRSDVWILVPTGIIVNRLLDKAGELKYIDKLQSFFGMPSDEIRQHFYKTEVKPTLFGNEEVVNKITKPIHKIAQLYALRLKSIWKFVTEEPLQLNNRNGVPIFHLVFASNNEVALKIAKHIIKNV